MVPMDALMSAFHSVLLSVMRPLIDAGISAGGRHGQPAKVMRPTLVVAGTLRRVRKTAMGHAQQGAAVPVNQVDLDQARSRRHLLIAVPTEAVGESVDRHDLAERSARHAAAETFDEIEPARMHLGLRLRAHAALFDALLARRCGRRDAGRRPAAGPSSARVWSRMACRSRAAP